MTADEFRERCRQSGITDDKPLSQVLLTVFVAAETVLATAQTGARGLTPEGEAELVRRIKHTVQVASERHRLRLDRKASWIAGGALAASLLVGALGGYWWGWSIGRADVEVIESGITKALMPANAAGQWLDIMAWNDIHEALKHCSGDSVFVSNGQKACMVPLWIDGPGAPQISRN